MINQLQRSITWCSDIHLNFLTKEQREPFYCKLRDTVSDLVVISGDIAESHNVVPIVEEMELAAGKPVFFVCGNHDFYMSSIKKVKNSVKHLNYIPKVPYTSLNEDTALLGVDGWGDCRYGDYDGTQNRFGALTMSDWLYIDDLRKGYGQGTEKLKLTIQEIADKDARSLKRKVVKSIKDGNKKLIIVTHVPPFEEASLHAGRKSTPAGLPFFASKILGDTILPIAKKHSEVDFLWLCGHTHSRAVYMPCENMTVKVAKSEYFLPQIEEII